MWTNTYFQNSTGHRKHILAFTEFTIYNNKHLLLMQNAKYQRPAYQSSGGAVPKHHQQGGLKEQSFILAQLWRPEGQSQGVCWDRLPPRPVLAPLSFPEAGHPLAHLHMLLRLSSSPPLLSDDFSVFLFPCRAHSSSHKGIGQIESRPALMTSS